VGLPTAISGRMEYMVAGPNTDQIREALMFSQFRFKLIEFLKLPSDIREPAFREVLERTSSGLFRNYLARAERVREILNSEDGGKHFEDRQEMSATGCR
jgi:hypothetical protein